MANLNRLPIFENQIYANAVSFAQADGAATKKNLVPSAHIPTEGLRIDQISVVSTDSSARELRLYENDGTTDFLIGGYSVPAGSGTGTTAIIDLIPLIAPALGYLSVPFGRMIKVEQQATITAARVVDVVARGGKYTPGTA